MKEKINIKKSWDDVTLGEYQQICLLQVDEMEDDIEVNSHLLSILSDRDFDYFQHISLQDFQSASLAIAFTATPPKMNPIKYKYVLGGVKYNIAESVPRLRECPISELRALQYIGLNVTKNKAAQMTQTEQVENLHNFLSVMMIPEGKRYGVEGYSVSENGAHLQKHLPIRDALAVSAFFLILWNALITGLNASLEKQMKKMVKRGQMSQEQREQMTELTRKIMELNPVKDLLKNGDGNTPSKW